MLILAYHRVNPEIRDGLSVSPSMLRDQMVHLLERDLRNVVLDDALASSSVDAPATSFAVTFDDGYQDNYIYALPVLRSLGIKATVFLVSAMIDTDQPFPWLRPNAGSFDHLDFHMTTPQLSDAMEQGVFSYGSHTRTHPLLSSLESEAARIEIHESKLELQDRLGVDINTFCYPAGDFTEETIAMVEDSGYRAAVVTPNRPIKETMFTLHRVGVYSHMTSRLFRVKTSQLFDRAQKTRVFWRIRKWLPPKALRRYSLPPWAHELL